MAKWHFRPKQAGETIREPIHGEFFASDAISDPGMALVREGIQNALDAGTDNGPVIVRIYLSGDDEAVAATDAAQLFDSTWEHFNAPSNGLNPEGIPTPESPCRFIAFEDFATSGLEGDPKEAFRPREEGQKNHFYHFFRAEGQSDKEASDRGSWGVGKHVFLRSSQVSTIFGLTVRADDGGRMLMGKSVLKSHYVGDEYCQDGYFGVPLSKGQQLVLPVEDAAVLNQFAELFDLQRGADPGLSLIVPWPDPEITEKALISAVLRDYFYPILTRQLEVFVETPSFKNVLDATNLLHEVGRLDPQVAGDLKPLIELASWAQNASCEDRIVIKRPPPEQAMKWSSDLLSDDQLKILQKAYYAGNRLAVRVPVNIRKRDGSVAQSFFDVYMVSDTSEHSGRPTYIREGIIISEVDAPRTRGVRAIVVIHDTPLAGFLRKAENPSHTQWHHARLKDEYKFGYKTDLEFLKRSVYELIRLLTAAEKKEDQILLADFFSIPAPTEEESVKTKQREGGEKNGSEPPVIDPPPPRPQRFRIQKLPGGFSILPSNSKISSPHQLDIRIAYDLRRGNPLKKYNTADFEMDKEPIRLDPKPKNLDIVRQDENRIVVAVNDPEFALHVTGFDERRQLYIKAVLREVADGNSQV